MVPIYLFLLFKTTSAVLSSTPQPQGKRLSLAKRADCQTNPNWQADTSAWISSNTDQELDSWWTGVSSNPSHQSFANELGRGFGGHLNGFQCGIGAYSTCIAPACANYQDQGNPSWSYLALLSVVNLNQFFNAIYTGITNGQADYQALTGDIANRFFPWDNPHFILGDAVFWVVALVTVVFAIPAALLGAGPAVGLTALGIGAFVAAGVNQVGEALEPDAISSQLSMSEGLAQLNIFAEQVGSATREGVEIWANRTMYGEEDSEGMNIMDYLQDGSFTGQGLPTFTDIEQFYKKQMVSRTINAQWKKEKMFVTFYKTNDPNDASGPNTTRYYSAEDGGVYYLYRYTEDGVLQGHLDKPWGLDYLNGTTYGINGLDITKALARAFRAGGYNYTQEMSKDRIAASMSSEGKLTPFKDGAGWEGTWTLPVCDMGTNNWNTQYGNRTSRYGTLPCCCGPSCTLTKNFTTAANLHNFQTLLRACKHQLKDDPNLKYDDIDYGFKWKKSFVLTWATFSLGQKVGVGAAIAIGGLIPLLLCCCCCCC